MMPTLSDVESAAARIRGFVHHTPIATSATFDRETGLQAVFKCENLQKVGAFKARGALNAVLQLSEDAARGGVVTHSSGNHGAAVAWAASIRGIPATVVIPTDAPAVKVAAVRGYGATVVPSAQHDRAEVAARVLDETGGILIHPYDAPEIIAGQGTATLELLDDAGPLDAIVAPVGGGGLLSGAAVVAKDRLPTARILGGEPDSADDAASSLETGALQPRRPDPSTIADGLLSGLGALPFAVLSDVGARIIRVGEEELIEAGRFVVERMKLVIEPSAAVAVAAARIVGPEMPGARVGILLSGGNTDLAWLTR